MAVQRNTLTRIGVFFDGNYFTHVNNYYFHYHSRKSRIRLSGLLDFIKAKVAQWEETDKRLCRIIDAHYFRGRLSAAEAQERNLLYGERLFEDALMRDGIVSHYMPMFEGGEKGVDVGLALEAYERCQTQNYDVLVIIGGDGDFLPLVSKINGLGTRIGILAWNFEYEHRNNTRMRTRASQRLLEKADYSILVNTVIEDSSKNMNGMIDNLFMPTKDPISQEVMEGEASCGNTISGVSINKRRKTGAIMQSEVR